MKKQIKEPLYIYISLYDLEGTIDEVIEKFQNLKKKHGDFLIDVQMWSDESPNINVYRLRDETEEEEVRRIEKEKNEELRIYKQQEAFYEELKAKLGK